MKEFAVYTALRLVLFLVTWGAVLGAWTLITGEASLGLTLLVALVISGVGSYWVLRGPREAFARRVEHRAGLAVDRYEQMRAREDVDES